MTNEESGKKSRVYSKKMNQTKMYEHFTVCMQCQKVYVLYIKTLEQQII